MLILKNGDEAIVKFLAKPTDFPRFWQHNVPMRMENGYVRRILLPCVGRGQQAHCLVCNKADDYRDERGNEVRTSYLTYAPVYVVDEKRMCYFRAGKKIFENLAAKYSRNAKRFLNEPYAIFRSGDGLDTEYHIEHEDKIRLPRNIEYDEVDIQDVLNNQARYGLHQLGLLV